MRQRKVFLGLLVLAALTLGLVPGSSSAADPWACAAVNGVQNSCTVTSTVAGGALWRGGYEVWVNGVKVCWQNNPDAYHLSTVPVPPSPGAVECKNVGGPGKTVLAKSLSPGGFVIVGSRG